MNAPRMPQMRSNAILFGAIMTFVMQTATLGGIVFKGAQWSEHVDFQQKVLVEEQKKQGEVLERVVNQLVSLEQRVHDLEARRR